MPVFDFGVVGEHVVVGRSTDIHGVGLEGLECPGLAEVRVVLAECGEIDVVVGGVGIAVDGSLVGSGDEAVAQQLIIGYENVFNVVLRVHEHGAEVHAGGGDVLQAYLHAVVRLALETYVASLAEDEVGGASHVDVALCTNVLGCCRCADGLCDGGGGHVGLAVLEFRLHLGAYLKVVLRLDFLERTCCRCADDDVLLESEPVLDACREVLHHGVAQHRSTGGGAALLPFCERVGAWRVAQDHFQFLRSGGHEVVACSQLAQYDAFHAVADPLVGTSVDVVGHGDGAGVWLCDVGQSGLPLVGGLALVIELQLVALQVDHLSGFDVLAVDCSRLNIYALCRRECVADGDDAASQWHVVGLAVVGIDVLLVAFEQEGVVILHHEQGCLVAVDAVVVGHQSVLGRVDVVDGLFADFVGVLIAADAERAVGAALLPHAERGLAVVGLLQAGVVLVQLVVLAALVVERVG